MKNSVPSILLVDDSSTNNLLLESALRSHNFKIYTAVNGEDALSIIKKKVIDLVLLDIMMPGLSGYDVLETMGKDKKMAAIPVIMVSARNRFDDQNRAKMLGAADYFEKPLNLEVLISRVKELV